MSERGFYADSRIEDLVERAFIFSTDKEISEENIQPASFEPRIGHEIFVGDFIDRRGLVKMSREDLVDGYLIEKGKVYRIPLMERLTLPREVMGLANPKSRTGRAGLSVRLIADEDPDSYNVIPPGYKGPLSLEVYSKAFDYLIKPGMVFNQIRFVNDDPERIELGSEEIRKFILELISEGPKGKAVLPGGESFPILSIVHDKSGRALYPDKVKVSEGRVVLHHSLNFPNSEGIVAYLSKRDVGKPLDLRGKVNNWEDFFEAIRVGDVSISKGYFATEPNRFFLSSSEEILYCPQNVLMATVPYNPVNGDFLGDHAGFVDPGFFGTLTFEPYFNEGHRFLLYDGIPFGSVKVAPVIGKIKRGYGPDRGNEHFAQFGVRLGPFFRK